jgi:hypothetical protein
MFESGWVQAMGTLVSVKDVNRLVLKTSMEKGINRGVSPARLRNGADDPIQRIAYEVACVMGTGIHHLDL